METVILKTFGDIFFRDTCGCLQRSKIENEFVCTLTILPPEQHIVCAVKPRGHVVSIQNGNFRRLFEAFVSIHLNVHPGDGKDGGRSEGSSGDGAIQLWNTQIASAEFSRSLGIHGMAREERSEVCRDADGSDSGSAAAMGDAECFVQVQMADVGTNESWTGQTHLSIHIRTIHIHLTTRIMHHINNLHNLLLKHTERRRVSNHERRHILSMFLHLCGQILQIDISLVVIVHHHDLHPGHGRRGGICSMGTLGNETDIAMSLALLFEIFFDDEEASVLTRGTAVGLGGHGSKASDFSKVLVQVFDELMISLHLIVWREGVDVAKARPSHRDHF
mmetsp:Transcript_24618/g.44211  ORF Transcript_24618/g.44211 Transcript_24618/m.44211 type:complete len:333 (-) Transcript_24618:353-1351(-)